MHHVRLSLRVSLIEWGVGLFFLSDYLLCSSPNFSPFCFVIQTDGQERISTMSSTLTIPPPTAISPSAPSSDSDLPIPVSPNHSVVRSLPTASSSSPCNLFSPTHLRPWKQPSHSSPPSGPPVFSTSQTSPPLFPRLSSLPSSSSQPASSLALKRKRMAWHGPQLVPIGAMGAWVGKRSAKA